MFNSDCVNCVYSKRLNTGQGTNISYFFRICRVSVGGRRHHIPNMTLVSKGLMYNRFTFLPVPAMIREIKKNQNFLVTKASSSPKTDQKNNNKNPGYLSSKGGVQTSVLLFSIQDKIVSSTPKTLPNHAGFPPHTTVSRRAVDFKGWFQATSLNKYLVIFVAGRLNVICHINTKVRWDLSTILAAQLSSIWPMCRWRIISTSNLVNV